MRILFINNDGGGFADEIEIADGTSVQQLFDQRIKGKSADYLIRVNRQPTTRETVLQPGDRVSITPTRADPEMVFTPKGQMMKETGTLINTDLR